MAVGTSVVTGRSAQMQGENKSQLFAPPASVKGPLATLDRTRFCPVLHPTVRRCSWLQNELERTCFFSVGDPLLAFPSNTLSFLPYFL